MKHFKIPKTADWKSIPINSAKFVLEEGKDHLDYTLKESDKITNRAYSITLLLFAIISGIAAYTFDKMVVDGFEKIIFLNFILIFAISYILFQLGTLIFPRTIMAKGRIPKKLALPEFLNNPKLNDNENYLSFIIQNIEVVQDKIDFNLVKNENRQNKLKINMITTAVLLLLYLIIAFFTVV